MLRQTRWIRALLQQNISAQIHMEIKDKLLLFLMYVRQMMCGVKMRLFIRMTKGFFDIITILFLWIKVLPDEYVILPNILSMK